VDGHGAAALILPSGLSRAGLGAYRVLASASPEKYQPASATATFVITR
jgi:hypothetical protein